MTQREKVLTTSLIGILLVFGGGFLFHLFVYEPVAEVRAQLDSEHAELLEKQNALAKEQQQIENILKVNPRLNWWHEISLPPKNPELKKLNLPLEEQKRKHINNLGVAYEDYLSRLMAEASFGSIKVETRGNRSPAAATKGKEPPFNQLTFGVVGEGTMESVTKLMRDFYKTPLLHHIRTMKLDLAGDRADKGGAKGLLKMDLTVDAMIMPAAEERPQLEPEKLPVKPKVLAEPDRNYAVLNKVNMFTGYRPAADLTRDTSPPVRKNTEDRAEVLRFVKLTMLSFDPGRKRWEATLYDQAKGGGEKRLNTGVLNEYKPADKDDNPVLEAKVVKIDEENLVMKADGKYYRMRLGDFVGKAIGKSLSRAELKALGITPDESEMDKKKEEE